MNWTGQCFICNQTAYVMKGGAEIFNNKKPLKSEKELPSVISEIIKKPVTKGLTHSTVLCSKCNKMVVEYDLLVTRCQKIENDVLELFKVTLKKLEMDYDNYASTEVLEEETVQVKPVIITRTKPEPKADPKKIVLSASKLQPLPPNFVLRPNIMPDVKKKVDLPIVTKLKPVDKEQIDSHSEDIEEQTEFSSLLKFNEMNLHNYSLSAYSVDSDVKEESDENGDGDGDDNPMEIDEECTLTDSNLETSILQGMGEGFVRIVPANSSDTADNMDRSDDDEGHTIVMDEDGSIIRVVSGQRFMLGDQEISLQVMPDGEALGDSQDSNDESQIELQVSGDEETANAIIAAAQEKGGAFIKVESGEMYRVESVESKDDSDEGANIQFQVEKKAEGLFRCKFCERYMSADKVFEGDATSMMSHLKTIHEARLYICTVCGKIIRRKSEYGEHLSSHSTGDSAILEKGKLYECNECHKKFSSRALLAEHLNTHVGARPYVCGECGKDFANKYTYQAHCKTHTNRPRSFKCNQCEKSFFSQQNLSQHEKTHSGIKDFICKICGKAFGTQHNLEVHGVVHSRRKPFACRECGKAFARRAELRDHERIHTGERPFECEICHARFAQRSNLYSHRRATHTDDKRYACDRCPKRFKRKRLLDYHIQSSHTGERPLTCGVCGAKFVYPEHYKKHMLIHSGAKPFQCEICGKSFNSRDNRNMHRFVHSDRKAYECLVCGASFMRKSLLYAHMNQRGHMAESIVINQPRIAIRSDYQNSKDNANAEGTETTLEQTEEVADSSDNNIIGTTLNIAQDGGTTMLAIHNADGELKTDEGLLQTFSVEQLDQSMLSDNVLVSTEGQQRPVMRLVQLQLRDGNTKWVAVDG